MTTQFTSAASAATDTDTVASAADLYGSPPPPPVVQSCICGCGGYKNDCFYQSAADTDFDLPYSYLRWMAKRGFI